ncbi:hypothetical protein [Lacibacter sp. H407]|uniref:hypothetical protein n=1 Tax=Lacibacter sp. H407 TaxID=3133423 RepID=UPI0030C27C95
MSDSSKVLNHIPKSLRDPLIECFQKVVSNYTEHKWEPSELNGGKFCEVVYAIINGYISGAYPSKPAKPANMLSACQALERQPSNPSRVGDRSVRVLIPRILPVLYEIRNNRGVGHVGGDVDPNFLDATAVYSMTSWVLAELVRVFHNVTTQEAQETVDVLIERKSPLIWEVGNIRRVLKPTMKMGDQTLLLLHTKPSWVKDQDLCDWVEYSTLNMFRKNILEPYHKKRLIEYDKRKAVSRITPLGIKEVEERIIKSITV